MDLNFDDGVSLYPIYDSPIPDAVLMDHSTDYYLICWKPTNAGVIYRAPELVEKQTLAQKYPKIVEAWETKRQDQQNQARGVESNFMSFAKRFLDQDSEGFVTAQSREIACDQSLRAGMIHHWGPIRKCEAHPPGQARVFVCKGCRVSHCAQESRMFDRSLIMTRGARVPVCRACANTASKDVELHGCVCDSRWTCYKCREAELGKLAKARKNHTKGQCGKCLAQGPLVQHADFCLYCQGWRVYAGSSEGVEDWQ
jgi:hypothetical protein